MKEISTRFLFLVGTLVALIAISSASQIRWLYLGSGEAGSLSLSVNGKPVYTRLGPESLTPYVEVPLGTNAIAITGSKIAKTTIQLSVKPDNRITIVSVADEDGNVRSRIFNPNTNEGNILAANMLYGSTMTVKGGNRGLNFGNGVWFTLEDKRETIQFKGANGFHLEAHFELEETYKDAKVFAVLHARRPSEVAVALFDGTSASLHLGQNVTVLPQHAKVTLDIIDDGNIIKPGSFDPTSTDWTTIHSRILWLNHTLGDNTYRLELGGYPALRRVLPGSDAGFLKWPPGQWPVKVISEQTGEEIGATSVSLGDRENLGLVSIGGEEFPHGFLQLEGRNIEEAGEDRKTRIRFVNALPTGILNVESSEGETLQKHLLKPAEVSQIVTLAGNLMPRTRFGLKDDTGEIHFVGDVPQRDDMPIGDWILVIHLDPITFEKPVLSWVDMDHGQIIAPPEPEIEE